MGHLEIVSRITHNHDLHRTQYLPCLGVERAIKKADLVLQLLSEERHLPEQLDLWSVSHFTVPLRGVSPI